MINLKKITLDKSNRMLRVGIGKHDDKWFARIDLWWFGVRLTNKELVWEDGRQGTGYRKKTFFSFSQFDGHLIHYPQSTYIPPHRDVNEGYKTYRLNIKLRGEQDFYSESVVFQLGRVVLFRPDISTHSVPTVTDDRLVLSFGFCVKEKNGGVK
tara:strand:- start:184 stop:645 length:462 start_codon:yes stop_codon:yes gene_type:complete